MNSKSIILGALCAAQIAWAGGPLDNWSTGNITTTNSFQVGTVASGNGFFVAAGNILDYSSRSPPTDPTGWKSLQNQAAGDKVPEDTP
ncbi:MAG: hypothetical protein ACYDH9_22445 [Limisphaerales bacterium]